MFVLLIGFSLSLVSARALVESSCSGDSCRRNPGNVTTSGYSSEERVLAELLCYLDCLDRGEENGGGFAMCHNECSGAVLTTLLVPTLPPPSLGPAVTRQSDDGHYVIAIPNVTDETGSGETGSGETGSGRDHEVYLVRVIGNENETYISMTTPHEVISLAQFACSAVSISYATVMAEGIISEYSPSQTICVFLPQDSTEAARNLVVEFEEDTTKPQQAIVSISWDKPSDVERLEGYELLVTRIPGADADEDDDCAMQDPMDYRINKDQTNFTILPLETEDVRRRSPLYTCTYIIELVSLPGNNSVSEEVEISYNARDRISLEVECRETYIPKKVSYDLAISWTIEDPLVLEAVSNYGLTLTPTNAGISAPVLGARLTIPAPEFEHVFTVPVVRNSLSFTLEVNPRVGKNDPFNWRRPIIPGRAKCFLDTIAFPPDSISSNDIIVITEPITSGVLSFSVTWSQPAFVNGDLVRYELCIGEDAVTGSNICAKPADCLFVLSQGSSIGPDTACRKLNVESLLNNVTADIDDYHIVRGTERLFLQIRTVNEFALLGNWSDPVLLLQLMEMMGPNTATSQPSSEGCEVWVYVVVPILGVVVITVVVVLVLCVYRHFCFHRRIKYEDTFEMERIRSDYHPPYFIPVADGWEVPYEDIEIFYGDELGHGAFGRVYRGLLHSQELRDMVNGGGRRGSRKRSLKRRRSSRKMSQTVGSSVVAIKRLKDNIDGPDKANFLKEIEMMKRVSGSSHDHQKFVVNMLGCVTVQEPMMLVLEYAYYGDLLTYLRDSRDGVGASNPKAAPYLEPQGAYSKLSPRDSGREGEGEDDEDDDNKLTAKDLLSFARQIAAGMEFLSSRNVVHRDLACRNILVCEDHLVKISDFGLSRSLVNQEAYVTTSKGVLPIRWMAPEAIFYRTFDTQSDVWSYGILLWELYTLGGYPYPTMSNRDILELLATGYRMDKPELCSDGVYDVMLRCWNPLGLGRPNFTELYAVFDGMLSETTRYQSPYIQVLGACYYDTLSPRVQVDREALDLDRVPANVDDRHLNQPNVVENNSLQETGNGFLNVQGQSHSDSPFGPETRGRSFNQSSLGTSPRGGVLTGNRSRSPSQERGGRGRDHTQVSRLGVPLHLSRPQSWVGTSSAELGPRYVPTPLYLSSPHSSTSNLTQETTFGSSIVTLTPEHRLPVTQSRSVGSIPLLSNANLRTNLPTDM